jgi:hypothetical protein
LLLAGTLFLCRGLTTFRALVWGQVAVGLLAGTAQRGRSQAAIGLLLGYFGLFWLAIMIITLTGAAIHGS